jgi:acyl carrier protein
VRFAALDALAADRAARGKPALAVAFGPVADVGLAAAEAHRGNALARLGFDGLRAADAIDAIDRLLASGRAHAVCAPFDAERWLAATAHTGATGLVDAAGAPTAAAAGPSLREALEAAPAGAPRRALLEAAVRDEVASVLRLAPQRVPADRALKSLGLDSLMALELRNRLERRSGAALSPTLAWNHPTLAAMAAHLAERLGVALDAAEAPAVEPDLDALLAELEQMSDDEARAQLERGDAA